MLLSELEGVVNKFQHPREAGGAGGKIHLVDERTWHKAHTACPILSHSSATSRGDQVTEGHFSWRVELGRKRAMDNETTLAGVRDGGWARQGFLGTCNRVQGHLLSPQISDILTPAAPRSPHSHFSLFLSCSSGYVWNQQDEQSQGHGIQAGHELGKEGRGAGDHS